MDEEDFIDVLSNIFDFKLIKNNQISFEFKNDNQIFKLKKKRFKNANLELKKLKFEQGFELFNKKYYEVSLNNNSNSLTSIFLNVENVENVDHTNKIKYKLSNLSDAFLLKFINELKQINTNKSEKGDLFLLFKLKSKISTNLDLFDTLKNIIPQSKTLQINSENDKHKSEFETISLSYLFNLSYNTDLSYLPNSFINDLNQTIKIGTIRRSKIENIDFPKRKYEANLILYYQRGISSESIDLKYLSFYHIIEHFFEKIYNEDLINSIKNELTKPSFSYKRNKDVSELLKIVQKKLKYKNDEFQINESEALKLVLDKFIFDFQEIKKEINSYDKLLISYFKSNEIEFSNGNRVNFDESREKILKNLSDRIYKTRNSIVHSKETEKSKYLPFKHDKILQKEIFLMRIIAEKIIIESSKEI